MPQGSLVEDDDEDDDEDERVAKIRLDQLVAQRALAESREQAQRLIRTGRVRVKGQPATKPGHTFPADIEIEVEEAERFVGRGGQKLEAAFEAFAWEVQSHDCLDVGASTGGFTDCLLQHGASHVYAVDVGRGQLHQRLREDSRVTVMEGINARHLEPGALPTKPTRAVVDVSFISLTKLLCAVTEQLDGSAELVTLIKPQFEAGRADVARGGVVRDERVRERVVEEVKRFAEEQCALKRVGLITSPLKGPAGNVEFLAYWQTL